MRERFDRIREKFSGGLDDCRANSYSFCRLAKSSTDWQADFHRTAAIPVSTSGKNRINAIHRVLFLRKSSRLSLCAGMFRNNTDHAHRNMVSAQLWSISIVPRQFG